jgi:hypothetical protein
MRVDRPHPLSGEREVAPACARLNLLEMAASDRPPPFVAWCAGRMGPGVTYVSFRPNARNGPTGRFG